MKKETRSAATRQDGLLPLGLGLRYGYPSYFFAHKSDLARYNSVTPFPRFLILFFVEQMCFLTDMSNEGQTMNQIDVASLRKRDDVASLKKRAQALQAAISQARDDCEITLGVLGPRNSGKTALFASWYLHQSRERNLDISVPNDISQKYLYEVSEQLKKSGRTPQTRDEPNGLTFNVTTLDEADGRHQTWIFKTIDFPGEFLQPRPKGHDREIAKPSRDFLKKCDVVMCLFDCLSHENDLLNAISLILHDPENAPYLILVVTKMDRVPDAIKSVADDYGKQLEQLRLSNRQLDSVINKITHLARRGGERMIGISALGVDFPSESAPYDPPLKIDDFKPRNLFRPLQIAIEYKSGIVKRLEGKLASVNAQIDAIMEEERIERKRSEAEEMRTQKESMLRLREKKVSQCLSQINKVNSALKNGETNFDEFHELFGSLESDVQKLEDDDLTSHYTQTHHCLVAAEKKYNNEHEQALWTRYNKVREEYEDSLNDQIWHRVFTSRSAWIQELNSIISKAAELGYSDDAKIVISAKRLRQDVQKEAAIMNFTQTALLVGVFAVIMAIIGYFVSVGM